MDELEDFISEWNANIEELHNSRQKTMNEAFEKYFHVVERSQIEQALNETYPNVTIYKITPASIEDAVLSGNIGDQFPYYGWILQAWRCEYALEPPLNAEALEINKDDIVKQVCYVVLPVQELKILGQGSKELESS